MSSYFGLVIPLPFVLHTHTLIQYYMHSLASGHQTHAMAVESHPIFGTKFLSSPRESVVTILRAVNSVVSQRH